MNKNVFNEKVRQRLAELEERAEREGWLYSERYWDEVDFIKNEWLYRKHPEMR